MQIRELPIARETGDHHKMIARLPAYSPTCEAPASQVVALRLVGVLALDGARHAGEDFA